MKIRSFGESKTSAVRIIMLVLVFVIALVIFTGRLLSLQVANNEYYKELAVPKKEVVLLVEASRGEIVDRNGVKLVANVGTNNIRLNYSLLPKDGENEVILGLLRFFDENGIEIADKIPMPTVPPYTYMPPVDSEKSSMLKVFLRNTGFEEASFSGSGLYNKLYERYAFAETIADIATEEEIRRVMGVRYALEGSDFSVNYPHYTVYEDAPISLVSKLAEIGHELPGVEVYVKNSRYYPGGSLAAHVLGRIGAIEEKDVEKYTNMGYQLNEQVGKYGAEAAFEKYLRGVSGFRIIEYSADGEDVVSTRYSETNPPIYGKTVTLTLSAGMQAAAEKALKESIDSINLENIRNGNPERASGAVAVVNCNTGEAYAIANYPTYDQNTYRETISDMLTDKSQPLFNRAVNGIYPPGSTFKIATAIAALSEGVIDENTLVYDTGVYREYESSGFTPECWYHGKYGIGHGYQNVVDAIKNSCNYFFFEAGKNLGVDSLNSYAKKMGLGELTGIEIGEDTGVLAGPEHRASQGRAWHSGDLIVSAIGQSDNVFTPIQLASFFSTVVNGGTRYKLHILKSVNDYATGEVVLETKPEVLDTIEISDEHLELVKRGMKSVMEDGTAASTFKNYPYSVGGKTGTAQRGAGTDNTVFAGFAPYDDPDIVVSVVIEAGDESRTAAVVAKGVFDYYYENLSEFAE